MWNPLLVCFFYYTGGNSVHFKYQSYDTFRSIFSTFCDEMKDRVGETKFDPVRSSIDGDFDLSIGIYEVYI